MYVEGRDSLKKLTVVYILGVPAWVIILVGKHDWIAASIEAGGIPAMMFGLYNVYMNPETPNKVFDRFASFCTYSFLIIGVCYSLYDYGVSPPHLRFLKWVLWSASLLAAIC